eukprot:6768632-Prymnesium_polylepis.1
MPWHDAMVDAKVPALKHVPPAVTAQVKGDFALKHIGQQQGLVVSRDAIDEEVSRDGRHPTAPPYTHHNAPQCPALFLSSLKLIPSDPQAPPLPTAAP